MEEPAFPARRFGKASLGVRPFPGIVIEHLLLLILGVALSGASASLLLGALARRVALRLRFLAPTRTPLGGGIALVAAISLVIGSGLALVSLAGDDAAGALRPWREHLPGAREKTPQGLCVLALAWGFAVLGLRDDARALGPGAKFLGILALCLATPLVGIRASVHVDHAVVGVLVTTAWLLFTTNAVNLFDNADGAAAAMSLPISAGITLIALTTASPQYFLALLGAAIFGAVLGFGAWNRPPARLYLGDAGSLSLGYLLGVAAILLDWHQGPPAWVSLCLPVVLFALPLYDTASVIVLRLLHGQRIWRGDHRHWTHRLDARGISPNAVVAVVLMLGILCAAAALALPRLAIWARLVVAGALGAAFAGLALWEWRTSRPVRPGTATLQATPPPPSPAPENAHERDSASR